jgi:superfamily II DNA or RNA helicase
MKTEQKVHLDSPDQLHLLQLLELKEWTERSKARLQTQSPAGANSGHSHSSQQSLLSQTTLLPWQKEALERWADTGYRGIAKVVTGAGKTIFGLAAADRLQKAHPNLLIAIIVPTIVLMSQWHDEILARSNLPASAIGALGGGADDKFDDSVHILICVLNSAARKLPEMVQKLATRHDLLMIVDECHRAGATEMRRLFETPRQFTLGLSATPERDDDPDEAELEESDDEPRMEKTDGVLEREIGPIFFEMNYAQAIEQGILSAFTIEHYALSLTPDEQRKYDALSQEITDLRQQLETRSRRGLALIRWCRSAAGSRDPRSRRFIGLITERKQFLYRIEQRHKAVECLLADALERDSASRIIIFHESISEVMNIFAQLRKLGYKIVAEHSEFSDRTRAEAISLFRRGIAQIIVSAKSLIEGFNVPSADIGLVVAASSSVRQRVQTLGRLLRRGDDGKTKKARLIVLFAEKTVDELIYEKANWNEFVGTERNEYFRWPDVENTLPKQVATAPRTYIPSDYELDSQSLQLGNTYPGKLEGDVFTVDTGGTVLDAQNRPVKLDQELMSRLNEFRGGGRFLVTPRRYHLVKLVRGQSGNDAIYLGQLSASLRSNAGSAQPPTDPQPGEHYPLELAIGKRFSVLQRDERLIARKDRGHAFFVERLDKVVDVEKRSKLSQIQEGLRSAYRKGHLISKIFVNEAGHVGYLYQGQAYFLGHAPEGPAGFLFETP